MRVVNLSNEAYEKIKDYDGPARHEKYHQAAKEIQAVLNAPVELGSCRKVNYDHKTDRYSVTFGFSEKTATLKVTNPVAEFCTANLHKAGSWQGRMESGVLVDVNLLTV